MIFYFILIAIRILFEKTHPVQMQRSWRVGCCTGSRREQDQLCHTRKRAKLWDIVAITWVNIALGVENSKGRCTKVFLMILLDFLKEKMYETFFKINMEAYEG